MYALNASWVWMSMHYVISASNETEPHHFLRFLATSEDDEGHELTICFAVVVESTWIVCTSKNIVSSRIPRCGCDKSWLWGIVECSALITAARSIINILFTCNVLPSLLKKNRQTILFHFNVCIVEQGNIVAHKAFLGRNDTQVYAIGLVCATGSSKKKIFDPNIKIL